MLADQLGHFKHVDLAAPTEHRLEIGVGADSSVDVLLDRVAVGQLRRLLVDLGNTRGLSKLSEITGLDITLSSVIVRMNNVSTMLLDARAGSGALTFDDGAAIPATIGAPADNNSNVYLGGALMSAANDGTNADTSDLGLVPTTSAGINYYTMASTGVTFAEDDSLWLRRRNSAGVDTAYQLGAFTLNIVPEPSSAMLVLGGLLALGLHRRR